MDTRTTNLSKTKVGSVQKSFLCFVQSGEMSKDTGLSKVKEEEEKK